MTSTAAFFDWDHPLVAGDSVELHWMADGSGFWYAEGPPDQTVIYKIKSENKRKGHSMEDILRCGAMLIAPYVYKVGIASAPLADFTTGSRAIEPYLDLPQDHQAEYDFASNSRLAGNLKANC
jgi:hypothetical protein